MRITGLATGLDMDSIIKESMKPYRVRIQQQQQNKEILEIKQKLYRDVIKDSRELYNKYFDVTKSDSLLLSKNWTTTKFQSSNESAVTVTAGSGVNPGRYTVEGKAATATKAVVTTGLDKDDKITINGKEFTLKGESEKERAANLNTELKNAKMNVSVRYTDFAADSEGASNNKKGFIFESTVLGSNSTFTIGGTTEAKNDFKVDGKDATGVSVTSSGFTLDNLVKEGSIKIGDKIIDLDIQNDTLVDEDRIAILNKKISDYKLTAKLENGQITFTTTEVGSKVERPNIEIGSSVGDVFTDGTDATNSVNTIKASDISGKKVSINGNVIDLSKANGDEVDYLNEVLKEQNMGITAGRDSSGNIIFTSNATGSNSGIDVITIDGSASITQGENAEIKIRDDKGGVYTHTGVSNTVTLDGVTFKINGTIPTEGVKITGKSDVNEVKDKLVNFINDYNTLMEKLNTITNEKRNRSYMPLTDEQKKEMSETEIKLWNERVEKGQLSRDSDITRIANKMKQAMRGLVDGVGSNLEKIGIKPVSDYQGAKNGTFTIDESKLIAALETNSEEVMNLFVANPTDSKNLTEQEKYNKMGIAQRLKSILYDETVTVSSRLIKKAGIEGTASATTNELTKSIEKYERKMKDMETDFSRREQALYSKYATLETMMNKLNSQQSYLASQLGLS
ncbi:flagellar filament capping protein FliD [Clostridium sp. LP20]|uniref:flagellar filament capping protein FliD n=1 Tax=Clostridium sp. LP20 TaxID=3418665 RepID=UPI003EE4F7B1